MQYGLLTAGYNVFTRPVQHPKGYALVDVSEEVQCWAVSSVRREHLMLLLMR